MNSARSLLVLLLMPVCGALCSAQIDTSRVAIDTARIIPLIPNDTLQGTSARYSGGKYQPAKKPWVAVGLSAALPGLGQIYDHSYWKLPIIWGLGGYWVYEWGQNNSKYQDYRQKYSASINPYNPSGNNNYLLNRDFYRNERDSFAWYLGALYFMNLVDAYVGASLYDFDVTPELGADGRLVPKMTATIRLNF